MSFLTMTLLLGAWSLAQAQNPSLTRRTLVHRGVTRVWFEHLPAGYDGSRPVPLVIAMHGFNNRAETFAPISEWAPEADAGGFLVVFPNGGLKVGDNFGWNDYKFNGEEPDDVGFLLALIQRLKTDHRLDPARVYLTGFSNGASITHTFAGVHASAVAAIAPVSSDWLTGYDLPESLMRPGAPLPTWIWGGDRETFIAGNKPLDEQQRDSLRWWTGFNGNGAPPAVTVRGPHTTSVYPGGRAETRFTLIRDGEHAYQPGTSARIWREFFSRISRGGPSPTPTPTPPTPLGKPVVSIRAEPPRAFEENRVPGAFIVTRAGGDLPRGLTVPYLVTGPALGGVHYKPLRGEVTIPAGAASATVRVKPLNDGARTGDQNVKVILQPSDAYVLESPVKAKVRIVDGD